MPNGNYRGYQPNTYNKGGVSEGQIINPKNPCMALTAGNIMLVYFKIEI